MPGSPLAVVGSCLHALPEPSSACSSRELLCTLQRFLHTFWMNYGVSVGSTECTVKAVV